MSFQYLAFYKPFNVLSQFSAEGDKQTLADYLPDIDKDIYPVGRLDYDSEGLLLLTNDKTINHRLLNPMFAHKKTYYVQVEGMVTGDALKKLEQGVSISVNGKQHKTKKALAQKIEEPLLPDRDPPIRYRKNIPTSWLSLTISEGKNRQVRKMTATVGFPTLRLVRFSIGGVDIGGLTPGTYKSLTLQEKDKLFER